MYHSFTSSTSDSQSKSLVAQYDKIENGRILIGEWLKKRCLRSTVVAINPAGIIPYYTRFRTIDMLGLNDKHIARSKPQISSGAIGHLKFDSDYVISKKPDIILIGGCELLEGEIERDKIVKYYQFIAGAIPGDRALLGNKRLYEEYTLVAASIDDERFLPLFLSNRSNIKVNRKTGIVPVNF